MATIRITGQRQRIFRLSGTRARIIQLSGLPLPVGSFPLLIPFVYRLDFSERNNSFYLGAI